MKKTRFTEEQMVTILREADQRPVPEVAKKKERHQRPNALRLAETLRHVGARRCEAAAAARAGERPAEKDRGRSSVKGGVKLDHSGGEKVDQFRGGGSFDLRELRGRLERRPCSSRSRSKTRLAVWRCFLLWALSCSRIWSMIPTQASSLGRRAGCCRR